MNYTTAVFIGEGIIFLIQIIVIIILWKGIVMADKQDEGLKLLKEIRSINHMIEELQMQIDGIYSMLTSTTVKPKEINIMTSSDPDPMATRMCKILEYQEQLQKHQAELCDKKLLALKVIQQMDIDNQRIIILRYYKGYSVEEIGEKINYSYRWAWEKIHDAEKEFLNIYEKTT